MSEIPPPPSPKKEVIAPIRESIAEEFADDPPDAEPHYGEARLWLVARDPRCLFAYWGFRPEEHPDATAGNGCARFFLRVFRGNGAAESSIEIEGGAGHAFIPAESPDSGYFAEHCDTQLIMLELDKRLPAPPLIPEGREGEVRAITKHDTREMMRSWLTIDKSRSLKIVANELLSFNFAFFSKSVSENGFVRKFYETIL